MRRLRESWLALGGSALIIALSVSSALGADPAFDPDNVGQQVSEFARGLAPGQNQDGDEQDAEEVEEFTDTEEQTADAQLEGEEEEFDATLEPGVEGYEWANHGECVSWHAREDASDHVDENDGEAWFNHGEFVTYWATQGCAEEGADDDAGAEGDSEAAAADEDGERAEKAKKEKRNNGRNGNGRGRSGRR